MKTQKSILFILGLMLSMIAQAQTPKMAVVSFDIKAKELRDHNLTELLRIEVAKHGTYEVIDRYEVKEILSDNDVKTSECFSKTCLISAGKLLKADKVMTGAIDKLGEALFLRVRMFDVTNGTIEKEVVKEFLFLPAKVNTMLTIAVNEIMGVANDKTLEGSLTSKESYASAVNNPHYNVLELSGPRMGYTFLTGEGANQFSKPRSQGGYDGFPAMFQFGYQFEKQYLNEGKMQALFEFLPMVTGLDQGLFIPSLTIMNGLRNNVNGLELAIGPSMSVLKESKQFMDEEGNWQRASDVDNTLGADEVFRMDSRGDLRLKTYVVIAAGFSLRSGKMNIPINAYVIPSKNSTRFGISFGFNARG